MSNDEWQSLAEAIVMQATRDYRTALRGLRKNPEKTKELVEYFRSNWFQMLCVLDGVQLMRMLENEVRGKHK